MHMSASERACMHAVEHEEESVLSPFRFFALAYTITSRNARRGVVIPIRCAVALTLPCV